MRSSARSSLRRYRKEKRAKDLSMKDENEQGVSLEEELGAPFLERRHLCRHGFYKGIPIAQVKTKGKMLTIVCSFSFG